MLAPAKLGIAAVSALLVIALFSPLLVFLMEAQGNPEEYMYVKAAARPLNRTHVEVTVAVLYSGTVPLRDFAVTINEREVAVGDVSRGNNTRTVVLGVGDLGSGPLRITALSYRVAGLYYIKVYMG